MTEPSPAEIAVYQALASRYTSNVTIVWTVPALGLSAQAFLIGAGAQQHNSIVANTLLSVAVLMIGFVTGALSQKFDYGAWIDRLLLDRFESRFLEGDAGKLRLLHAIDIMDRGKEFANLTTPVGKWRNRLQGSWIIRRGGTRLAWSLMVTLTTIVGAAVPIVSAIAG
jgi:hypothetical protein